jgi:putative redox protein
MSERLEVFFPGGKRVDVQIGGFRIATDQSAKAGGEASAPEPFALFLASMAACAGIYALNFCHAREIPAQGLKLSMLWERDPVQPLQSEVRFQVKLPEGFPDKYREGIVRAMDLCAVKKHIQNPPEFTTEILV